MHGTAPELLFGRAFDLKPATVLFGDASHRGQPKAISLPDLLGPEK